jgi:hypothetical protein
MSDRITTEAFFRPDELGREQLTIPAALFNRCRLMLTRCESEHVFVPIRSMQYQAVIDRGEIIFADSHGGYAVRDGHGGRLIVLAWKFSQDVGRNSLNEPVPIDLVSYSAESREIHRRVMSEFPRVLDRLEERLREYGCEPRSKVILPFQTKHG